MGVNWNETNLVGNLIAERVTTGTDDGLMRLGYLIESAKISVGVIIYVSLMNASYILGELLDAVEDK